ncbi:Cytochrome P450 3A12 [Lasiodiplodia theobromae]|uniref:Cytochrome P450 3A12 n=1 Tax=Lasiodiplodia theobromae TaxID=45133 RepID=A0A5N5DRD9_9PEZI|nr:Cytochrome P450 3A12 [Lasiodiplodia theobromae]
MKTTAPTLLTLPPELLNLTLSHLRFPDSYHLRATCRLFASLIPALPPAEQPDWRLLLDAEKGRWARKRNRLTCVHCARLLPATRFTDKAKSWRNGEWRACDACRACPESRGAKVLALGGEWEREAFATCPTAHFTMALAIGVLVGGAVLAALYRYVLYPAFFSPLAKIPAANFSARFSNLWLRYIRYMEIENRTVYALHVKHGPIVRLGPNELSINCVEEGIKTIYPSFPKTAFYSQFDFFGHTNAFTTLDTPTHGFRRRMFSHAYSKSVLLSSSSLRATTAAVLYTRLLPVLSSHAASSHPVDVLPLAHSYAMDAFTAFQFGLRRGSNFLLDKGEREWYMESMYLFKKLGFWVTEMPVAVAWLRRVGVHVIPACVGEQLAGLEAWNMAKFEGAERAVVASDDKEEKEQIGEEERIEEEKPENKPTIFAAQFAAFKKAFGDDFADEKHASDPRRRRLELASDQMDFNAAALETSGLTLTWLLYELSQRPALQRRLRDEVLTLNPPLVLPDHASPTDDNYSLPDPKHLDQLPLLDAVLHETLRRWPAIAGRQPRVTPSVVTLAGHAGIPAGVTVQAYAYSLHRNGEVFAEPEEWRPERWMVGEEEGNDVAEMRRWFWAFGSGGRVCVGRHFAVNAIKHAVAAIYTNFETELVDAEGIEQADGFIPSPKGEKLVLRFRRV